MPSAPVRCSVYEVTAEFFNQQRSLIGSHTSLILAADVTDACQHVILHQEGTEFNQSTEDGYKHITIDKVVVTNCVFLGTVSGCTDLVFKFIKDQDAKFIARQDGSE